MPTPAPAPDFDLLLSGIRQVGGPRFRVDEVLEALPDDQRGKVLAALRDVKISPARISKALRKMGPAYKCSDGAIVNWRERHDIA